MNNASFLTIAATGVAVNVNLGYIPHKIEVFNMTDGNVVHHWFRQSSAPGTAIKVDAAVAPVAAPNGITALNSGGQIGVTLAAAIAVAGKTLQICAFRDDYNVNGNGVTP